MGIFSPNVDKLEHDCDITALKKCLKSRNPIVRLKSFNALARILPTDELNDCSSFLIEDPDLRVRNTAVLRFFKNGSREVLPRLKLIITKGSQQDKLDALRVLGNQGCCTEEISQLFVLALNDKNIMVQVEAIRSMGDCRDNLSIFHLRDKLQNSDKFTLRLESIKALGKIGSESAVDDIIGALLDEHPEVRMVARKALDSMESEKAQNALNSAPFMLLVKKMNENVSSRIETIKHISRNRYRDAIPLLVKALDDDFKTVRLEAVKALGILRDNAAVTNIIKLIDDRYYDIRLEAVKTLQKIPDIIALRALERAMEDEHRSVREEATEAYYDLKNRLEDMNILNKEG